MDVETFIQEMHRDYLTAEETARALRIPVSTLNHWAWSGKGPTYVKVARERRYPMDSIRRFMNEQERHNGRGGE